MGRAVFLKWNSELGEESEHVNIVVLKKVVLFRDVWSEITVK